MSSPRRASISAIGICVPQSILTNAELEKIVETSDAWIVSRTGIKQRHIANKGMPTSCLAAQAAHSLLVEHGVRAPEIEAILVATVTPDMQFPSTACIIQNRIGAAGAWGFDLSAGCSGFVYALQAGCMLVQSGAHKKILVIGADVMSSIVDYTDRATCVMFGDGAGAVLIEPAADNDYFLDFASEMDGANAGLLYMPGGGSLHPPTHETIDQRMHTIHQKGDAIFRYAVQKLGEGAEKLLHRNGLKLSDVDLFVPSQSNRRIINAAARRLGFSEDKVLINIDQYGNTSGASIPLALDTACKQGKLKKGHLVLIASIGAGMTRGMALLRWAF